MPNSYTELNPGLGGDYVDESIITYGDAPLNRKRARVVVAGDTDAAEIGKVTNSDPATDDYGLVVRHVYEQAYPGTAVCNLATAALIAANSETTVTTYTVPNDKNFYVAGFSASGDINAKFCLYINGVAKLIARTTAANLNIEKTFLNINPKVASAGTVTVSVTHYNSGLQGSFDVSILGYVV